MSSNPKFQVSGGTTPLPNWLYDALGLTPNEKVVAWGYHRSAYGSDTTTTASVRAIARKTGLDKRTVKAITARLLELGVILPKGPRVDGYAKKYDLALTEPPSLEGRARVTTTPRRRSATVVPRVNTTPTGGSVEHPQEGQYNTHIKSSKTNKDYASPRLASSSLAEATSGESVNGSAASPRSAGSSEIEVNTEPRSHGKGNAAELATLPGHNGRNKLLSPDDPLDFGLGAPSETPRDVADEILDDCLGYAADATPQQSAERPYTKRTINEYTLSPEGVPLDDDRDELFYEVEADILPRLYGEPFNPGDLEKLANEHGVAFCRMWAHWLERKIASEYKRKPVKGVPSPTGLFTQAVREGWKVDPAWPQFDETLHTVAARKEYRKRQEARELKHGPKPRVDEIEDCFGGSVTTFNDDTELPGDTEADLSFA